MDEKPGLWGYSYEYLINNKKVDLPEDVELKIIDDLKGRFNRLINVDEDKIRPFVAEKVALMLGEYYKKKNKNDEANEIIKDLGKAYERSAMRSSAIQASAKLRKLHSLYLDYQLKKEAENVEVLLNEIGPKIKSEMKPISGSINIGKKEIDEYINTFIECNLEDALNNIVVRNIPIKNSVKDQLNDLSKTAPMVYLFSKSISDEKGRVVATVGSYLDDLDGNIIYLMSQNMSSTSFLLNELIKSFIAKFKISDEILLQQLFKSPVFRDEKREIIRKGLETYFNNDHLVALHVLVPQFEDALRNLIEMCEGSVFKINRTGGFHYKTLDEILRDPIIENIFDENMSLYFRVLFTDPRGWNIRNNLCHGIGNADNFGKMFSDRVIHAFMCLSLLRLKK